MQKITSENTAEIVKEDLQQIIQICTSLIGIADEKFHTEKLDNRAYNVLLILKQSFEDELQQIEQGDIIPF